MAAAWPVGVHRIQPGDSGSVTVRFMTTADAPNSGTPARPATWTSIGVPSGTFPTRMPVPSRVSNNRAGETA